MISDTPLEKTGFPLPGRISVVNSFAKDGTLCVPFPVQFITGILSGLKLCVGLELIAQIA